METKHDRATVAAVAALVLILSAASVNVLLRVPFAALAAHAVAFFNAHACAFAWLALSAFVGSIVACARRAGQ